MPKPKFGISDLLLLALLIAVVLGSWRMIWTALDEAWQMHLFFATTLLVLVAATLGAWRGRIWQRFCLGYAAFYWLYLVTVLHAGFSQPVTSYDFELYQRKLVTGVVFSVVSGVLAHWFLRPPK